MSTKTVGKDEAVITAYIMKTKKKNVPLKNCVIEEHNGRYMAKGDDGAGNKACSVVSKAKAEAAVAAGNATWAKKGKK